MKNRKNKKSLGMSTLEYAAGAAIIITIVWLGMKSFGTGMNEFLNGVANWASQEGTIVGNSSH